MRWTIRPRFVDRIRLRHAALTYSEHGWDVTPGACLAGARPHTVLLATGRAFDALEVPAHLGLRGLGLARLHGHVLGPARVGVRGPVAVTPTGRWMFLVRPGDPLRPELDCQHDVVRHGRGSWIPAPPTRLPEGPVHWAVSPVEARWELPDSYAVQALLVDALTVATALRVPSWAAATRERVGVPRQASTGRRAA